MSDEMKLYIDTSVFNFIFEKDRPDSLITYNFFKFTESEKATSLVISDIVQFEIERSPEPRKSELIELVNLYDINVCLTNDDAYKLAQNLYDINVCLTNDDAYKLAQNYIKDGLFNLNSFNDALHMANATVSRCNFLVSWNFKHMVRAKTIWGVHKINFQEGYGLLEIVSPRQFLDI